MNDQDKTQKDSMLPEGAIWAKDIDERFIPPKPAKLSIVRDTIGPRWQGNTAFEKDVEEVMNNPRHTLFFPQQQEQEKYPHFDTMNGLVYKTHIPGVIDSYEEIVGLLPKGLEKDDIILDTGVGTGIMTMTILNNTDATVMISDYGVTGILGLLNLAQAGYEILVLPDGTKVDDLDALAKHVRETYDCKVIYMPLDFDGTIPKWLKVDYITCDHSIVYTPRKERFTERIQSIVKALKPGGGMLITQLNHDAPPEIFELQKKKESSRIKKTIFKFQLGRLRATIKALNEASKIKGVLQDMQLPAQEAQEVLKQVGDLEIHEIQDGLNLAYVVEVK